MSRRPMVPAGEYVAPLVPDGPTHFKVSALARILREPAYVIRYWETEFDIKPKRLRSPRGQRYYTREQVDRFVEIHRLIRCVGLTHPGVRDQLATADQKRSPEKQLANPPKVDRPVKFSPDPYEVQMLRQLRSALKDVLDIVDEWERRSKRR